MFCAVISQYIYSIRCYGKIDGNQNDACRLLQWLNVRSCLTWTSGHQSQFYRLVQVYIISGKVECSLRNLRFENISIYLNHLSSSSLHPCVLSLFCLIVSLATRNSIKDFLSQYKYIWISSRLVRIFYRIFKNFQHLDIVKQSCTQHKPNDYWERMFLSD